ncbi:MAG: hypothetical protein RLY82_1110 [Pseudomonadota bacterium]
MSTNPNNITSYQVQGITCDKCVATVTGLLQGTKYTLHKVEGAMPAKPEQVMLAKDDALQVSWLLTYKPLLILIGLILLTSVLVQVPRGYIHGAETMRYFMAGFFLSFAFFKLLDIPAFADAYAGYDLLATKWRGWGYVYPFVELGLGMAYLANWQPTLTNWVTFVVMGFSAIGVIQAVMNKRKIRCACLGAVFQLPMSTVTIVEDVGMVAMAVVAIWMA